MNKIEEIADKLINAAITHGGGTISQSGSTVTRGIAVAVDPKHEVKGESLFRPSVVSWVRRMMKVVEGHDYYCFGVWEDDGMFYLDVVDVLPDVQLTRAIEAAKDRNQLAIYHLTTATCLRIEE